MCKKISKWFKTHEAVFTVLSSIAVAVFTFFVWQSGEETRESAEQAQQANLKLQQRMNELTSQNIQTSISVMDCQLESLDRTITPVRRWLCSSGETLENKTRTVAFGSLGIKFRNTGKFPGLIKLTNLSVDEPNGAHVVSESVQPNYLVPGGGDSPFFVTVPNFLPFVQHGIVYFNHEFEFYSLDGPTSSGKVLFSLACDFTPPPDSKSTQFNTYCWFEKKVNQTQ